MRNIRSAITVGLAAGLALLPAQGAFGESFSRSDPVGDVVSVAIDAGPNLEHIATLRPGRAHGDIVSMRALHGDRRVIVGVRFRNIKPTGPMSDTLVFKTDRSRFSVQIDHTGRRVQSAFVYNESADTEVRCPDLKVHVGVLTDRLGVSVPRGCLHRPRWVRVGGETSTFAGSGDFDYDDAMRRGHDDPDWTFVGPALGPRLHRA